MTQATILIVDDEKHTRDGMRRLLEDQYDVYVAADIASATDVLERDQIDVLITDLRLAGEDGMTLIERALTASGSGRASSSCSSRASSARLRARP